MPQTLDNLTYTWNNSGTTFTGIKFNVTDTASAAGSLLMDLQVGGVSKFKVDKAGAVTTGAITATGQFTLGNFSVTPTGNRLTVGGSFCVSESGGAGAVIAYPCYLGWTSGLASLSPPAPDLTIFRDLANTLAQRNGTNAQTFRLYGTYTDASNYRRLTKTMSAAGVAEIKPEGAGTGEIGNVLHISGLPTSNPGAGILWNDAGTVKVGT